MSEFVNMFPRGLLTPELAMGIVASVSAKSVKFNISNAGAPSASHYYGGRYGKGEVGEFVLIEGQIDLLLGRVVEIHLPDTERQRLKQGISTSFHLDAIGTVQLLGSVKMDNLQVTAGVEMYPRLGDRVYSAPHKFISELPKLMEKAEDVSSPVSLDLGSIDVSSETSVSIKPEKLFGRHCAILGATGGGKSWTTARLVEQCSNFKSKIILVDPTGEYRGLDSDSIRHCHLGSPPAKTAGSEQASLPPSSFRESDFIALFRPSPGIQTPKLREALSSLRIVHRVTELGSADKISSNGVLIKRGKKYDWINKIKADVRVSDVVHNPSAPFDINCLVSQIEAECVWENEDCYGNKNDQHWGFCSTLASRIAHITNSPEFDFVFRPPEDSTSMVDLIGNFVAEEEKSVLRICLSGISQEYQTKEIVANALGRYMLDLARKGQFEQKPIIIFIDEAHNFLGKHIGESDTTSNLDAFEIIAKEGRKFGLNLCLATQRPRDVTEGVLSQMGTLIVHRLTNDRDREVVERACGEIDKSASSFLPNLQPGEAAIIGADFPIPLTVKVSQPRAKPKSDGPNYQKHWKDSQSK